MLCENRSEEFVAFSHFVNHFFHVKSDATRRKTNFIQLLERRMIIYAKEVPEALHLRLDKVRQLPWFSSLQFVSLCSISIKT